MSGWALAVDGGNTKTLAVVAGADGEPRGRGRGGCADIYNAGSPALAVAAIETAARAALAEAGAEAGEVASAVFSLAGADWPEDFVLLGGRPAASASGSASRRWWSTTRSARCGRAPRTGPGSPW